MAALFDDLLDQAKQLAKREPRKPKQASLRRAISTAYYALFHLLVNEAVRLLIKGGDRKALRQTLSRAFVHSQMKDVSQQFGRNQVSDKFLPALNGMTLQPELISVAKTFVDLQQARHEADYDVSRDFPKQDCLDLVGRVEKAFSGWRQVRGSLQSEVFLVAMLAQKQIHL